MLQLNNVLLKEVRPKNNLRLKSLAQEVKHSLAQKLRQISSMMTNHCILVFMLREDPALVTVLELSLILAKRLTDLQLT